MGRTCDRDFFDRAIPHLIAIGNDAHSERKAFTFPFRTGIGEWFLDTRQSMGRLATRPVVIGNEIDITKRRESMNWSSSVHQSVCCRPESLIRPSRERFFGYRSLLLYQAASARYSWISRPSSRRPHARDISRTRDFSERCSSHSSILRHRDRHGECHI